MGCNSSKAKDVERDRQRLRQRQQRPSDSTNIKQHPRATAPQQPPAPASAVHSLTQQQPNSKSIAIFGNNNDQNSAGLNSTETQVYGTSYTNRKTKEYELLTNIVKQTRHNFIDIMAGGQQPTTLQQSTLPTLNEYEQNEKLVYYANTLGQLHIPGASTSTLPSAATEVSPHYSYSINELPASLIAERTLHSKTRAEKDEQRTSQLMTALCTTPFERDDVDVITSASYNLATALTDIHLKNTGKIVLTFDELP